MSRRMLSGLLVAVMALAACGGGDGSGSTTSSPDAGSTSAPDVRTSSTSGGSDGAPTVGIDDIPQECIDAFVGYLRAIEPVVETVDWATATMSDFEEIGNSLESVTSDYEAEISGSRCEDLDVDVSGEEAFDYMIDVARREAPGTVGYFETIRDFTSNFGEGSGVTASNDCETDIEALQAIVDAGTPMNELPAADLGGVGGLVMSISSNCSQDRSFEFFSQDDVSEFLGG